MSANRPIDPARSSLMSRIRAKNTKPEILIRSLLHRRGFRFRLHNRRLPGTPDLVLPKYRVAIFVNGCFWHMHDCDYFRMPKSRSEFWHEKLEANRRRDEVKRNELLLSRWRVATIWECCFRDRSQSDIAAIVDQLHEWIVSEGRLIDFSA